MAKRRSAVTAEERLHAQQCVIRALAQELHTVVTSFVAFRNELDLSAYHQSLLDQGKTLLLPRVEARMEFYEVQDLNSLVRNKMGILEPDPLKHKRWTTEDIWSHHPLIITPGLAFTKEGYRLGYGGGYYDRFFVSRAGRGLTIGVGFAAQLVDELPIASYDIPVDRVLCC